MPFPQILPCPSADGYTGGPRTPVRRVQMDDGQYSDQGRVAHLEYQKNLSWLLTFEQTKIFGAWLEYTVNQGAGWDTITIGGKELRISPLSDPVYRENGRLWRVTLPVRFLSRSPAVPARSGVLPPWPAVLPNMQRGQYEYGYDESISYSEMDAQVAESRVRFQERVSQCRGRILMTAEQRDIFWDFYTDTLINGSLPFLGQFPSAHGAASSALRCRIINNPEESAVGVYYRISLQLETVELPIMSLEEYNSFRVFINDYVEEGYVVDYYVGRYV